MNNKTLIAIIIIIVAIICVAAYMLMPHSYGPGTYVVGQDIPAGTYDRTGFALGDSCQICGSYMIVTDGTTVTVDSGEIIYINGTTTPWW